MKIYEDIINEHHSTVQTAKNYANTHADPKCRFFAAQWLESLRSKTGNDILESVAVRSTGRNPKATNQKHGADSEDGELEAKPMKGAYTAHISDDTPNSLMRHHTIPEIVFCVTSEDGQTIRWVLRTSYRLFDNARYKNMLADLNEAVRTTFPKTLPDTPQERYNMLKSLKNLWGTKHYIRSNELPLSAIEHIEPHMYALYVNPDTPIQEKIIQTLWDRQKKATAAATDEHAAILCKAFQARMAEDTDGMTLTALREKCKELGHTKLSSKNRADLIALLANASSSA